MPGIFMVGLVVATLQAAPARPVRSPVKPPSFTVARRTPPPVKRAADVKKVCGMRMVIGDASVDPGILMGKPNDGKADARDPGGDSDCGSVMLVRPVKRQR